jgi:hypothetical protein
MKQGKPNFNQYFCLPSNYVRQKTETNEDPSEKTEGEKEDKEHAGTNPIIQIKDKIRSNKHSI